METAEWMIVYNENTGRHDYAVTMSKRSYMLKGTVVASVYGTEQDAKELCRKKDLEERIRPILHPDNTVGGKGGYR